jgi:hypothetical protein
MVLHEFPGDAGILKGSEALQSPGSPLDCAVFRRARDFSVRHAQDRLPRETDVWNSVQGSRYFFRLL